MSRALLALALVLAAGAPRARAQTLHTVRADGGGDFVALQAAVDAAADGDVLLVGPGTYAGFVVDGKALWISADAGVRPAIEGTVELRNVPASERLVLIGLDGVATTTFDPDPAAPALLVHDNAGHVRVQDCTFEGALGGSGFQAGHGGPGGVFEDNLSLVLDGCTLRGGAGGILDGDFAEVGGDGGFGARFSGSLAAVYGSSFEGGAGRTVWIIGPAGNGGDGCLVPSFGLYASGSTFTGGRGGNNDDFLPGDAGDGGDGLVVSAGAQAQLLDDDFAGGAAGVSFVGTNGSAGAPRSGSGIQHLLVGGTRLVRGASLAVDGDTVDLELVGEPGDVFWLAGGRGTNFQFAVAKLGVWLVPRPPLLPVAPVGTIPPSGTLTVSVPTGEITGAKPSAGWLLQAFVLAGGTEVVLGGPHALLLANCEALSPDCNGNGEWDRCDLLRATSQDCDGNGVPDECEADCNGNGIADACDIANGEPDVNGNGFPDSCEPVTAIWHVDPAAAPGGDGSLAFPFRTIREARNASLTGHEIVLHDGTYTGADNRGIVFEGYGPIVRSLNGPANCVIDLEQQDLAFVFWSNPANSTARVEGLTIRNGRDLPGGSTSTGAIEIQNASPWIVGCVFEDCEGMSSGALRVRNSNSRIVDCLFVGNRKLQAGFEGGGAVFASAASGNRPSFLRCTFVDNVAAGVGGAVGSAAGGASVPTVLSHCRFTGNSATGYGGAVAGMGGHTRLESCLLENNVANTGGGVGGNGTLYLLGCTVVGNHATFEGGAVHRDFGGGGFVRDSILYGNSAPSASQLRVRGSSSLTVEWSDVQGGLAAAVVDGGSTLTWGAGNVDADPLFVDPDGADDDPATGADNDWRLGAGSPCVDAGANALVPSDTFDLDGDLDTLEAVPFDLLGQPRLRDDPAVADTGSGSAPLVDLGALERQP